MKKNYLLIAVIAALTLIISACGDKAYEPEAINEETDTCDVCNMMVANNEHATQIVLKNDKVLMFDDLGCLYEWIDENGEDDIGGEFVRDYNTKEWVEIKDATFVYDYDFITPMAYGVYSFKEKVDAEELIETEGKGEMLTAETMTDHHWERNMEMMEKMMEEHGDHGDHGGHDEHDDHEEHD